MNSIYAENTGLSFDQGSNRCQQSSPLFGALEYIYVVFALLYMAPAFLWLFESTEDEWTYDASSNVPAFILQLFVYLLASIFILRHWRGFVAGLSDSKWAIMLVGLAIVSALWAWDPLFTFRRGLVLAATTAFGIYFGTRFTRDHQVALLCTAVSMIAILSVLIVVFIPHYGIDDGSESGGWRGVFLTKNVLGRASILGAIAFYCYPRKLVGRYHKRPGDGKII